MARSKEEVLAILTDLALELGRTPTKNEFTKLVSKNSFTRFGNYTSLVIAAGLKPYGVEHVDFDKLEKQYKSICAKKELLHSFTIHTLDLKELFRRAGNPPVLKVSAQPDTHTKYRDVKAVNCYLKFLDFYKPDVHIIMGDFVDCEGLSHWAPQDLEPRRIVPEMIEARKLLQQILDKTPKCSTRIFLTGNHSHWIDQALTRMPELFEGLDELGIDVSVKSMLGLEKFGYELFPLNDLVRIGKASFTHGLYTPTHHAKKHLDVLKTNIFYGHLHDTQSYNQTSVDGPMVAQSLGCLCRLDAKFLKGKPNNWEHAHGIFEFFPNGDFTYLVPRIINGRMSFNGVVFDGDT